MKVISARLHTIIGLIVGVALIAAPWIFGFDDKAGAVVMVPMYVGVFILLSELTTTSPLSPMRLVPMRVHVVMDVITGAFLFASPWLFGFINQTTNAWLPHIIVGLMVVGYALMTRVSDGK